MNAIVLAAGTGAGPQSLPGGAGEDDDHFSRSYSGRTTDLRRPNVERIDVEPLEGPASQQRANLRARKR